MDGPVQVNNGSGQWRKVSWESYVVMAGVKLEVTAPMEIISELRTLILSNNYFINKKKLNFRPRQGIIIITVVLNLTKRWNE